MFKKLMRKIIKFFPKFLQNFYFKFEEMLIYVFFGGLTTVVSFVVQFFANNLGASTGLATTISWIAAVTFAFFANKIFVFESVTEKKSEFLREILQFFAARLVSYLFEMIFMIVLVDKFGFNYLIIKLIAQVIILISNYLFSKFIVFVKKPKKDVEEK